MLTPHFPPLFNFTVAYIQGYASAGGVLTPREMELVPELIILRVLSNVVYFAGRAVSGEDSVLPLSGRADVYAKRCKWLRARGPWIVEQLKATMGSSSGGNGTAAV